MTGNILSLSDVLSDISEFVNDCLGPLGSNGTGTDAMIGYARDFIIQLIATLIIFLLVRFLVWKPITNMLEQRREAIDKELEEAKASNENSKAIELELQKQLADAQNEVKTIIDNAEMDANARREEIVNEAKAEAKRRLDNAKIEIEQEVKNKQKEIQNMIVTTAFDAASRILEKEVDKDKYLKVVNKIIEGAAK